MHGESDTGLAMKLDCYVYKGKREPDTYLFVGQEDDCSRVPEALLNMLGKLERVMTLELTREKKLARCEAATVLKSIEEQGFYLQLPPKYAHPEKGSPN